MNFKTKILLGVALLCVATPLAGCHMEAGETSRDRQTSQTRSLTNEADRQVGMPAITKFSERKLVRDILERRDRATTTYAYVQGMDGRLTCIGQAVGYGVPYGAQFTPPEEVRVPGSYDGGGVTVSLPEPNGLYMPDNASATWLQLLNPKTGRVDVVYLEPNIVVSPFKLGGQVVAADCTA